MSGKIWKENWKKISVSIGILTGISLLAFVLSPLLLPIQNPQEVKKKRVVNEGLAFFEGITYYPMEGQVVDVKGKNISLGVASQTYEINFGRAPPNSTVSKIIILDAPKLSKVRFYKFGNISEKVREPRDLCLDGKRKVKIHFNSSDTGNFTGFLGVESLTPKNWLAGKFLGC